MSVAEYTEGKKQFEERYKGQLKRDCGVDALIEWDNGHPSSGKFAVRVNNTRIVLHIEDSGLEDFGARGPESFRIDLLNRKQKELLDKLYPAIDEGL